MLTMDSHGVEISIAGCVEEMVRAQIPCPEGALILGFFPQP